MENKKIYWLWNYYVTFHEERQIHAAWFSEKIKVKKIIDLRWMNIYIFTMCFFVLVSCKSQKIISKNNKFKSFDNFVTV